MPAFTTNDCHWEKEIAATEMALDADARASLPHPPAPVPRLALCTAAPPVGERPSSQPDALSLASFLDGGYEAGRLAALARLKQAGSYHQLTQQQALDEGGRQGEETRERAHGH